VWLTPACKICAPLRVFLKNWRKRFTTLCVEDL
jgi:hypothetical protein